MSIEQELQKLVELEKHLQGGEALTLCERLLSELDSYAGLSGQDREGTRSFLKMRKAGLLRDKGRQQEALQLMAEALTHAESSGNKVQIGRCKLGFGVMHASLGNVEKGRQLLEEAVAYFRGLREAGSDYGVEQGLGWALLNLGRWMAKIGQSQAGITQLEEAVGVLQRIGNHVGVATAYEFLGEVFEAQGDQAQAWENYKHAKEHYEKEGMNEKAAQMKAKLQ
jgi:tetratricopeptide (TPR) repeat protein